MTKLTKLRIFLTLGALIGIAPVTYSFIGATLFLAVMLFKVPEFVVPVFLISTFGLWGCWKAYAAAMAREPKLPKDRRVIAAVIIALVWGLILAGGLGWVSELSELEWYSVFVLFYPMPGLTAVVMLLVTHRRARQASEEGVVATAE
ncbi:hypothetical protein [Pseudomonas sp. p106]|uniref:hypothetical protein n=1 Tax=Pseudomonas sp. p106 TaxID=2479854 RepID=UPI000F7AE00D|nr:hypothetical protein [Pseudomonas sp. p106]RRV42673.1 hypothetical protein EGJ09_22230 [Pseudomonas sp. p106]